MVFLRSSPRNVTLCLAVKQTISLYMPLWMKIVTGSRLPSGTKSIAPCTVAKSPEPSAATLSFFAPLAGGAAFVENRQMF